MHYYHRLDQTHHQALTQKVHKDQTDHRGMKNQPDYYPDLKNSHHYHLAIHRDDLVEAILRNLHQKASCTCIKT